nr:class I SAM-dependent methyltransferase [Butyrivibrio sp.]
MSIETKRKCISCGSDEIKELMTLENMPAAAQNMPSFEELKNDKPLKLPLCQCMKCGLVQFDIDPVYYYKDVIRAGGGTTTTRKLRHEEYKRLLDWMRKKEIQGRSIIEVGCGQGEFLQMWNDLDDIDADRLDVKGIENFEELVKKGKAEGLYIEKNFAEKDNRYSENGFDAFVQFNFLEHQPYPADMIRNIWMNLKDKAIGLITVPSFEYILENDGYYELMRDHIANYTVQSLSFLFENNGFKVLDDRMVNRDTIELIVEKCDIV